MKLSKLLYGLVATLLLFSSCSKKDESVKMIPKNALMVVHLNMSSFTSKLTLDDIKQTNWFKTLYADSSTGDLSKKILDNPQQAGVDFTKDLFIFLQKPVNAEAEIVVEGTISNASSFESFLKEVSKGGTAVKTGDVNMMAVNERSIVGWKGDKFAFITNGEFLSKKIGEMMDSVAGKMPMINPAEQLKTSCKNLFELSDDVSMVKVENFSKLIKDKGDLHWWSNSEEVMKTSVQPGMMGMNSLETLLKGVVSTATVDFTDGKIEMRQKMYGGDALMSIFKKYNGDEVDGDMIKNIPSKNVAAIVILNYKPEGIKELIKLTGLDGLVNMGLSQAGITIDDFVKANKGDLLFSVSDLNFNQDTSTGTTNLSPDARYLFAVSIGDKTSFNKLMDVGKKMSGDMSEANLQNAVNDKYLAIGNNQQFLSGFIQGGNNTFDFISKFSGHPICAFVDIQKIMAAAPVKMTGDSMATKILDQSKRLWENAYATGGEFKDDAVVMSTEINLLDKKTNSLKQLNQYADLIYTEVKKNEAMHHDDDETMEDEDDDIEPVIDSTREN